MGEQWKVYLCFYLYIIHIFLFTTFISLSSSTHTQNTLAAHSRSFGLCVFPKWAIRSRNILYAPQYRAPAPIYLHYIHSLTPIHNTINVFLVYYVYYFPRNNSLCSLALARSLTLYRIIIFLLWLLFLVRVIFCANRSSYNSNRAAATAVAAHRFSRERAYAI